VGRFAAAIGAFDTTDADTPEQSKRKKRKKDLLLNGPAKTGEGVSQDDVDALLNI
jgi:chemotaxis regulatin CheY-phosphate phosphatase CheZ